MQRYFTYYTYIYAHTQERNRQIRRGATLADTEGRDNVAHRVCVNVTMPNGVKSTVAYEPTRGMHVCVCIYCGKRSRLDCDRLTMHNGIESTVAYDPACGLYVYVWIYIWRETVAQRVFYIMPYGVKITNADEPTRSVCVYVHMCACACMCIYIYVCMYVCV